MTLVFMGAVLAIAIAALFAGIHDTLAGHSQAGMYLLCVAAIYMGWFAMMVSAR